MHTHPMSRYAVSGLLSLALLLQACGPAASPTPIGQPQQQQAPTKPFTNLDEDKEDLVISICDTAGPLQAECIDEVKKELVAPCDPETDANCENYGLPEGKPWFSRNWWWMAASLGAAGAGTYLYRKAAGDDWNLWDGAQRDERFNNRIIKRLTPEGGSLQLVLSDTESIKMQVNLKKKQNSDYKSIAIVTEGTLNTLNDGTKTPAATVNGYEFGKTVAVCIKADYTDYLGSIDPKVINNKTYVPVRLQMNTHRRLKIDRSIPNGPEAFEKFCKDTTETGYFVAPNNPTQTTTFIINVPSEAVGFKQSDVKHINVGDAYLAFDQSTLQNGSAPQFHFATMVQNNGQESLELGFGPLTITETRNYKSTCTTPVQKAKANLLLGSNDCFEEAIPAQPAVTEVVAKAVSDVVWYCERAGNSETFDPDNQTPYGAKDELLDPDSDLAAESEKCSETNGVAKIYLEVR